MSQLFNDDNNDENDLNYELLLTNFIQFNLNQQQTSTTQQNLDNLLNTCHNICKSLKLNKKFLEFLKKFNNFTQNLEKFRQFSALKSNNTQSENLLDNAEYLYKLYNCYDLIISHLLNHQNLIVNNFNHVILFINILLDLIKTVYLLINNYPQQHLSQSINESTQQQSQQSQQTLTQIVRNSFNNNTTLLNLIKLQVDLIQKLCKLIEIILNLSIEDETSKKELINLSNNLIGVIKSIKNDAKLMIILWKLLSRYLIKNQNVLEGSISLNEYLNVLNDELNLNLNYLKAKSDSTNAINEVVVQNLTKIIKICGLLLKLFKSILVAYAQNVNESMLTLLTNLIVDLNFIIHCDVILKQIKNDFINEFRPIIKFLIQFILTNFKLDFLNHVKKLNGEKIVLFLLSLLNSTSMDDLSLLTKVFQTLDYCVVDIYLPNNYLYINENDDTIESQVEFPLYLILCISSHIKHVLSKNNGTFVLNLVNFFLYYHLHGTQTQAQYSNECLLFLNKLLTHDLAQQLHKYYLTIYENTKNLYIKLLLIKTIQQTTSQTLSQLFDYINRKNLLNCQSLFYNIISTSPQLRQTYQNHIIKHVTNTQNQFIDCINQFFNEQQVIKIKIIRQFLINIKFIQSVIEFIPQLGNISIQIEQKFKDIYIKLIKLLKLFNINKLTTKFSFIIQFLCEIINILKLYNLNFKQFFNQKLILFQLNFMQQLNIYIETTTTTTMVKNQQSKLFKFYSIDYINSLAKLSSFENINNNNEISLIELNDDNNEDTNDEKLIIDKLVTYFCYLLNDQNCLIINLTLECLNDFFKQSKYFDFILAEIIRSNKLRMQDLIGNYLRKMPKKCLLLNDYEILSQRLKKFVEDRNIIDVDCEELINKFENDSDNMIKLYLGLNKPVWFRNKIESIIASLNQVV